MHATEIILPAYAFHRFCAFATFSVFAGFTPASFAAPMHEIMLLTGQSNPYHDWTRSSPLTGVDMASFAPKFSDYAPVVVVYKGAEWPGTGGVVTTSTVNIFVCSRQVWTSARLGLCYPLLGSHYPLILPCN